MKEHIRPTLTLLAAFSVLTGLAYPLAVTAIAQVAFPHQASGSLIARDGRNVGSGLTGQQFDDPGYFWGRPSATPHAPCNASAGSGRNWGPLNPALQAALEERVEALRRADPGTLGPIPVDLVTASGSGLDPHISPAAAEYQVPRVARARGVAPGSVRDLVARCTEPRQLGFLGEPRVNVLELNLALGTLTSASARP